VSYIFGDGFDCYAASADTLSGYWDAGTMSGVSLVVGRFAGGQALRIAVVSTLNILIKSSTANEAVHHVSVALRQETSLSGATLCTALQFVDASTVQCSIVFRSDGTILLTSGTFSGSTLATYAGAVGALNTWVQFEFEVVINNTTGSFKVRKNGNTVDDHSTTGINTRGGTANNYANKLVLLNNQTNLNPQQFDDLLWRSDATSLAWLGDIRCFTRMPASDASVQFTRAPNNYLTWASATVSSTTATTANRVSATAVTAPVSGVLASLIVNLQSAATGNVRMAVYDATGASGSPGNLIANTTSSAIVNPAAGVNTFVVTGGAALTKSTVYWVAIHGDVIVSILSPASGTSSWFLNQTYASGFPATMSGATQTGTGGWGSLGMNITPNNASLVNETLQDGTTSYVYDSTPGHADLYNIAALSPSPVTVHAVTTRGFVAKSDAGTRSGAMQIKSGATTVASPTLALSSSFLWAWRTDTLNPNGSVAWTPTAVDAVQVGPSVVS